MSRFVEIKIISAEGLMINRYKPVKKNAFVTVKTDPEAAGMSTKVDVDGGSYPTWNEKLVVEIHMHARYLTVEVQCKVYNNSYKFIGTVKIPVSDFTGGYLPHDYLHFLSYRLRDRNGERNGIINISVKAKEGGVDYVSGGSKAKEGGVNYVNGGGKAKEGGVNYVNGGGKAKEGGVNYVSGGGGDSGRRYNYLKPNGVISNPVGESNISSDIVTGFPIWHRLK